MPVYNFDYDNNDNPKKAVDQEFVLQTPLGGGKEERPKFITPVNDYADKEDIFFERRNVNIAESYTEIVTQGLRTMDRGIKNYFSGIQVPTRDGSRIMNVKISGGDKPWLIWAGDLKRGRVRLPLMSITRSGEQDNPNKFSPPYGWVKKRFADRDGSKLILTYRPVPRLINYTLSVWAEHKRDLEYIHYQISSRFNPCAEFLVEDAYMRGSVFMKYGTMSTTPDTDVAADQPVNKRYDYNITMEGWLPLPEKIVPSILGRVINFREGDNIFYSGDVLQ